MCKAHAEDTVDIAIIGGGAAGLTAAYFAAKASNCTTKKIAVFEKNDETGKKILISGGTRCNVLPSSADTINDYYTQSSPSALRALFGQWSLQQCSLWFEQELGIQISLEEETGKLFPRSNSAKEVRDKLLQACVSRGVDVITSAPLISLKMLPRGQHPSSNQNGSDADWLCTFDNRTIVAKKVILSTGGKSFPTLGTSGLGYSILKSLGHTIHEPFPALTPLKGTHPGDAQLAGLSVYNALLSVHHASVDGGKKKKKGGKISANRTAMLMTHQGFSGPAILDLSHYFTKTMPHPIEHQKSGSDNDAGISSTSTAAAAVSLVPSLSVSWLRDVHRETWEERILSTSSSKATKNVTCADNALPMYPGNTLICTILKKEGIPSRLADALCADAGIDPGRKLSELRKQEKSNLLDRLVRYSLHITGHEGYDKAEVTGGGVPLNELDMKSMESKIVPGLYVIGELCDVHGRIGGFNFWFAWSSGRLAGLAAALGVTTLADEAE